MALSPLSRSCTHQVFPSFCGADVRKAFLTHILKEFRSKGITPFIDNDIERSKSIGPELIEAIRGSKIAIVLISRNYASSTWCLNELVEIMKSREELGRIVMTIFYEVDPSDVKKQIGQFGSVFDKTCAGKTEEDIERWRQALAEVAQIAGYHSINWKNEAAMIEELAVDVSNKLSNAAPLRDFDCLVGMGAHMEKIEPLLCLESDEVRMIGIWGPSGIGKTTIARFFFSKHSDSFDLSVFMENIKAFMYARPACSDDYSLKLQLHEMFLSRIINQKDIEVPHLGVVEDRLKDKKVLVVLDDVDRLVQLDAMAKETRWFGRGSRIIITTQDKRLLKAHGIEDIYKVRLPATDEALQIFCMNAFGQNSPRDGFEELSWEVTRLGGELPLGLRVMGSYFRGMSIQEWKNALPRLRSSLDGEIQSILMFSYKALGNQEKYLFLLIACFFNYVWDSRLKDYLAKNLWDGIDVLAEKSLIESLGFGDDPRIQMHNLLEQLGKEIARQEPGQESVREPGKRQFLVDAKDICEVLTDDTGSRSVIGINLNLSEIEDQLKLSVRAFEGMSNLQFLKVFYPDIERLIMNGLVSGNLFLPTGSLLPTGLNYLSCKLKLLCWDFFPMACLPAKFNPEFLVTLRMKSSKLKKLWKGIRSLRNLKEMDLSFSKNLKRLPDLSTATSLEGLILIYCSSLVELPTSIGNAINLNTLDLYYCSSVVKLPSSIGNATNLQSLNLDRCRRLVRLPSSIGNLINLKRLNLSYCSSLVKLPASIGNLTNLECLSLDSCSSLVKLPFSIGNFTNLISLNLSECSSLVELPFSIGNVTNLDFLNVSGCSSLVKLPFSIGNLTNLDFLNVSGCSSLVKLPFSIGNLTNLVGLNLGGCSSLVELPSFIENFTFPQEDLYLSDCSSLVEVPYIRSWHRLDKLYMSRCKSLKVFPHVPDCITELILSDAQIEEVPTWVRNLSQLHRLVLKRCKKLVSLPQLPDSLAYLDAEDCVSLKRLECSFDNPEINLNFANCFKLNQEARELISRWEARRHALSPCRNLPAYFTHRAIKLNQTPHLTTFGLKLEKRPLLITLRFKVCFLVVKRDGEAADGEPLLISSHMEDDGDGCYKMNGYSYPSALEDSSFNAVAEVTSDELVFEFKLQSDEWEIGGCGIRQILEVPRVQEHDENFNSGDGGCEIKYDEIEYSESTDMQMETKSETEDDSVQKKKSRKPMKLMMRSISNFFYRRR